MSVVAASSKITLMAAALSISLSTSLKLLITLVFIFFFSFLPSKSVGRGVKEMENMEKDKSESESYVIDENKMVLGSRPPGCDNKCNSCRPCMAAVVVPDHRMKGFKVFSASSREEEDSYYLLSWKCRCGNKIYQP